MPKLPKLPKESFVSGDGWSALYVFNGRDFTTGYTITSQVRSRPSLRTDDTALLATPTITPTLVDGNTRVLLTLTGAQTRTLPAKAYVDIQVTQTGGEPLTLIQQEMIGQGDVAKS